MKEIITREELKDALKKPKTVVMYGKADCLHCTIMRNCIESVERHFPLIDFYYTSDVSLAEEMHFDRYPVLCAFENGNLIATLHGSGHLEHLKDHLDLWFRKD